VQSALNDAALLESNSRVTIAVAPGTYREVVCISGDIPVTLYGLGEDPSAVTIVFDHHMLTPMDDAYNPCVSTFASDGTYGVRASATFAVNTDGTEVANLSIVNDFDETSAAGAADFSAVALLTRGDRLVLEKVRISGNQFVTLFDTPDPTQVSRVYVKDSTIEGDMQYITGRGTVVIDHSDLHFLPARLGASMGSYYAMSTAAQNEYGLLIIDSTFTSEPTDYSGWVLLGRAWDEDVTTWVPGESPNGQAVIRNSSIGSHVKKYKPYGNALVTVRLFDASENRLYEYDNYGPGAAL
jgi:pectinesterase